MFLASDLNVRSAAVDRFRLEGFTLADALTASRQDSLLSPQTCAAEQHSLWKFFVVGPSAPGACKGNKRKQEAQAETQHHQVKVLKQQMTQLTHKVRKLAHAAITYCQGRHQSRSRSLRQPKEDVKKGRITKVKEHISVTLVRSDSFAVIDDPKASRSSCCHAAVSRCVERSKMKRAGTWVVTFAQQPAHVPHSSCAAACPAEI